MSDHQPLRIFLIHGGRERYLIVIDSLDEAGSASAQGEAWRNPLVEMLARNAQRLPDWLGLVVTSRPEFDVKTPLQALNPFPLDTQSESNRADIRDYGHVRFENIDSLKQRGATRNVVSATRNRFSKRKQFNVHQTGSTPHHGSFNA